MAHTAAKVTWVQGLLKELQVPNSSCGELALLQIQLHMPAQHIEVDDHFVHDKVLQKELDIRYMPTEDQIAGILKKPLSIS